MLAGAINQNSALFCATLPRGDRLSVGFCSFLWGTASSLSDCGFLPRRLALKGFLAPFKGGGGAGFSDGFTSKKGGLRRTRKMLSEPAGHPNMNSHLMMAFRREKKAATRWIGFRSWSSDLRGWAFPKWGAARDSKGGEKNSIVLSGRTGGLPSRLRVRVKLKRTGSNLLSKPGRDPDAGKIQQI